MTVEGSNLGAGDAPARPPQSVVSNISNSLATSHQPAQQHPSPGEQRLGAAPTTAAHRSIAQHTAALGATEALHEDDKSLSFRNRMTRRLLKPKQRLELSCPVGVPDEDGNVPWYVRGSAKMCFFVFMHACVHGRCLRARGYVSTAVGLRFCALGPCTSPFVVVV